MYRETTALHKILGLKKRIRGVSGGTSASKTISIIQWLIDYSQSHDNKLASVVSETIPHLKRGAIRDFQNIMKEHGYWVRDRWNISESTYTFESGTVLEFFSAEDSEKVKGARRDVLFINEANNLTHETFIQLEIRTRDVVWLDWNPVLEFWWYEGADGGPGVKDSPDADFLVLTYKDNEALEESIVRSIESKQGNKMFWQVYGLGQLGEVEGRIYTGWDIIDEVPHGAELVRKGLDFGYSADPAGLVDVYWYDGGYILDELLYAKGYGNDKIAKVILEGQEATVIADSAEPKSIDEIAGYGVSILPAVKGPGSLNYRIQFMQQQKISVTKRSTNLIKEYRNYLWRKDKNDRYTNIPQDVWNHALDAAGYAIADHMAIFDEVRELKPWEGKVPTTYIEPSPDYTEGGEDSPNSFTVESNDGFWGNEI